MPRQIDRFWPAVAGAALLTAGSVLACRIIASARQRRRLIERGELCELHDAWTVVRGNRVFSRQSVARGQHDLSPVVLVHGWGMSSSYFIPAAERLAAEFQVYAPDLPGHGQSDTPRVPYDLPQLAQSLLAWMDSLDIQRASLVGHSMGCQTAVEAALQQPERIDRLVLIGLTPDPKARGTAQQFCRLVTGALYERAALIKPVVKDLARVGVRLIPEFRFLRDDPIEEKLAKLTAPVMLVRGENDPLVPQRWMDEAARLVRADRAVVIPKWGHAVQFSAPGEVIAAIRPFLSARSPNAAPRA